jgi:hypothetical protein
VDAMICLYEKKFRMKKSECVSVLHYVYVSYLVFCFLPNIGTCSYFSALPCVPLHDTGCFSTELSVTFCP